VSRHDFDLVIVGTGSGNAIPPELDGLRIALVESNGKKARFLRHAQRQVPVANAEVVEARAEVWVPPARFDCVVTRAFGSLRDFLQATAALAAPGGRWLAMKGRLDAQELADVPPGFRLDPPIVLKVPGLDEARHLLIATRDAPR